MHNQYRLHFQFKVNGCYKVYDRLSQLEVNTMNTALPITPGEILLEKFLIPMEVSQNDLAKNINVSTSHINSIINGKRAITAETAVRLSEYFGNSAHFC